MCPTDRDVSRQNGLISSPSVLHYSVFRASESYVTAMRFSLDFRVSRTLTERCWYGIQVYVYLLVAFPLEGHDDLHMFSSCEIPCALHFNFHPRAFPSSFFAVCQCVLYCYLTVSS
jgi:hypothetical protein